VRIQRLRLLWQGESTAAVAATAGRAQLGKQPQLGEYTAATAVIAGGEYSFYDRVRVQLWQLLRQGESTAATAVGLIESVQT